MQYFIALAVNFDEHYVDLMEFEFVIFFGLLVLRYSLIFLSKLQFQLPLSLVPHFHG
jgi:hypothetical protein